MNSLWDIRIFLDLVPKESPSTSSGVGSLDPFEAAVWKDSATHQSYVLTEKNNTIEASPLSL